MSRRYGICTKRGFPQKTSLTTSTRSTQARSLLACGSLKRKWKFAMKIEKISTYIVSSTPSRSSSGKTTVRSVLMSLPRVRWLERDNPQPESKPEDIIDLGGDHSLHLTKRERELLDLCSSGKTDKQIADDKNMSLTFVKKTLIDARKKLVLRSGPREYLPVGSNEAGDGT